MAYLARVHELPSDDHLSAEERRILEKRFDANEYELNIDGSIVTWGLIEEIEIVVAARQDSPAGWLLKKLIYSGDRYHVGVYFGKNEIVLTNVTLEIAKYVAQTIAYYAQQNVVYNGIEGVAPLMDGSS